MTTLLESIRTLFEIGGIVMIPLFALSVLSLALMAERVLFWMAASSRRRRNLLRVAAERIQQGDLAAAESLLDSDGSVYSAVLRPVLRAARRGAGAGEIEAQGMQSIEGVRPRIERFGAWLSATVTAAPMLGILGTVLGIIQSFQLLGSSTRVTDPTTAAAGIGQALYTTAFGLLVAMVVLFPLVLFRAKAEQCLSRLEAMIALIATAPKQRERL